MYVAGVHKIPSQCPSIHPPPVQVDRDLAEVHKIRESLCDDEPDAELSRCLEEAVSPSITLRALHERVQARLAHWRGRRAEKLTEYEAVMVGQRGEPGKGRGGTTQWGRQERSDREGMWGPALSGRGGVAHGGWGVHAGTALSRGLATAGEWQGACTPPHPPAGPGHVLPAPPHPPPRLPSQRPSPRLALSHAPLLPQAINSTLKSQLGLAHSSATHPDLSRANLDFLRMEQDKMRAEKVCGGDILVSHYTGC